MEGFGSSTFGTTPFGNVSNTIAAAASMGSASMVVYSPTVGYSINSVTNFHALGGTLTHGAHAKIAGNSSMQASKILMIWASNRALFTASTGMNAAGKLWDKQTVAETTWTEHKVE